MRGLSFLAMQTFALASIASLSTGAAGAAQAPVVDRVVPLNPAPLKEAPGVMFFDDMERENPAESLYMDTQGRNPERFRITDKESFGGDKCFENAYLPKSEMSGDPGGAAYLNYFFGDCPMGRSRMKPDQANKKYTVCIGRWYHKFPEGFTPRPDSEGPRWPNKMARMRSYRGSWKSAWSWLFWIDPKHGQLSLERATSAPGAHRQWLPNYYPSFRFEDKVNQGRWIHFEFRLELGDGPRKDKWQAWADGLLIGFARTDDFSAGWKEKAINGMMWDCYWNGGSPVKQSRFYDDLSVSTEPMGPARTGFNPTIVRGEHRGAGELKAWEIEVCEAVQKPLEISAMNDGCEHKAKKAEVSATVVWKGSAKGQAKTVQVSRENGEFTGPLEGHDRLSPNRLHMCRIRDQEAGGEWSEWSDWHSGFATTWAEGTPKENMTTPYGYCLGDAGKPVPEPERGKPAGSAASAPRRVRPVGDAKSAAPAADGSQGARGEREAGRLLQMARRAERMGQGDVARMLYAQVVQKHPGTEAAAKAKAKLR